MYLDQITHDKLEEKSYTNKAGIMADNELIKQHLSLKLWSTSAWQLRQN